MIDGIPERYRTKVRHADDPPPVPQHRGQFDLFLPDSYVHRQIWEQAKRQGLQASAVPGVVDRPVDAPVTGQVVVLPRDEREAKYGKALALYDMDGDVPLGVVGGGEIAWQELAEIAAEARHYGVPQPERPQRDIRADWIDRRDALTRRRSGIKTTGALPTHR